MGSCLTRLFSEVVPGVSYTEAQRRIRSFDLVYFCHLGTWTSPFVAMISGKMITHMGIMYREPANGELYVLESVRHADTACDVASHGTVHTGVRLVPLQSKLNDPSGRYFVCIQHIEMDAATRDRAEALLPNFIRQHVNIPFEAHARCFLTSHLNRNSWFYTPEDTSSLYCSELAALTLRSCGLLSIGNVSGVWHTYFWAHQLTLERGARLSRDKFMVAMNFDRVKPPVNAALPPSLRTTPAPPPATPGPVAESVDEMMARIRSIDSGQPISAFIKPV